MPKSVPDVEPPDPETLTGQLLIGYAKMCFGTSQRVLFYDQLKTLLTNGMKMAEAIDLQARQAARRGKTDGLALVLADVRQRMTTGEGGGRLESALAAWIPQFERSIIASGERTGQIVPCLEMVSTAIKGAKRMRSAVLTRTLRPLGLCLALVGLLLGFSFSFMPILSEISDPTSWSGAPANMFAMSEFARGPLIYWASSLAIILAVAILTLDRFSTGIAAPLERFPPWSVYRKSRGAIFLLSLAAYMRAGFRLNDALQHLQDEATPWQSARIGAILNGIDAGLNLGDAMWEADTGFPDETVIAELMIYAKHKGFERDLVRLG